MNKKPMDCCHYNHFVRLLPKRSFVLSVKSLYFFFLFFESGKKITLSWGKFQLPLIHVVIVVLILTFTSTWNSFSSIISVLYHFISIKALMQFLRLNKIKKSFRVKNTQWEVAAAVTAFYFCASFTENKFFLSFSWYDVGF